VFIEGPQEKYEVARKLIEDIVAEVNFYFNYLQKSNKE